jgi:glycopeptide antibiotics resistance protein
VRGPTDAPRERRRIALAVLAAYLVGLLVVVLWPQHVDRELVPLIERVHELFPPITHARVEFAANVLLFVPPAALLASVLRRRRWVVAPLGFAASAVIETVQDALLPGRTADLRDVLANSSGAVLGLLLTLAIERMRTRRAETADR